MLAAAGMAPLLITTELVPFAALAFLAGLCEAPLTTCLFALIDEVTDEARRAEAFASTGWLYSTGIAGGAALAGLLVTHTTIRASPAPSLSGAVLGATIAVTRRGVLTS